jgi:hypothetical protein
VDDTGVVGCSGALGGDGIILGVCKALSAEVIGVLRGAACGVGCVAGCGVVGVVVSEAIADFGVGALCAVDDAVAFGVEVVDFELGCCWLVVFVEVGVGSGFPDSVLGVTAGEDAETVDVDEELFELLLDGGTLSVKIRTVVEPSRKTARVLLSELRQTSVTRLSYCISFLGLSSSTCQNLTLFPSGTTNHEYSDMRMRTK